MENLSSKSNITAAGGYFLMSLTIHLAFQTICAAGDALCVRDPDMWVCGGIVMLLVLGTLAAWRGKTVDLPQQRYPESGCQPWHISQRIMTQQ